MRRVGLTSMLAAGVAMTLGCSPTGTRRAPTSSDRGTAPSTAPADVPVTTSAVAPSSIILSDATVPQLPSPVAGELPRLVTAILDVLGDDVDSLAYGPRAASLGPGLADFGDVHAWATATTSYLEVHVAEGAAGWALLEDALIAAGSSPRGVGGATVSSVPTSGAGLAQTMFGYDTVAVGDALAAVARHEAPADADLVGLIVDPMRAPPGGRLGIAAAVAQVAAADSFHVTQGGLDPIVEWWFRHQRDSEERIREALVATGAVHAPPGPVLQRACGFTDSSVTVVIVFTSHEAARAAAASYQRILDEGVSYDGTTPWAERIGDVSLGVDDRSVVAVVATGLVDVCFDSPLGWALEPGMGSAP